MCQDNFVSKAHKIELSRADYYSFPCPLDADKICDDVMQKIVDCVDAVLFYQYKFPYDDLVCYFNNPRLLEENDYNTFDDIDCAFWREIEETALFFGMKYLEDED